MMNLRQQLREQSFKSLSHPVSIGAITLLLFNDHWLRWNYPSWWTGKIGDVAWLLFAPFLLTFMLSYLLPKNKLRYGASIAFVGIGLVFGLGNTVPAFHHVVAAVFQMIAGWQPLMYLDPTDLLTLPVLLIGWKIWQTNKTIQQMRPRPFYKHTIGWLMFSIGALGTMANSPSYHNYGIHCIAQQDEKLSTIALGDKDNPNSDYTYVYESEDGGLTWVKLGYYAQKPIHPCDPWYIEEPIAGVEPIPWKLVDPSNENIHWRIRETGTFIEQSRDAGKTWITLYEFPAGEQVRKYYYRPYPQNFASMGEVITPGGPYNGVVDKTTGNLIVSMGFEGVIVVTPEGSVSRVHVGNYAFIDIHEISLQDHLSDELLLALWLACLSISILLIPIWPIYGWKTVVIIGTVFWVVVSLFSRQSTLILLIYTFGRVIYPILAVIGCVELGWHHSWKTIRLILGTTIVSVILFMIPLIFWAKGIIPAYGFAITFSIVVAFLPIGYTFRRIAKKDLSG